MDIVGPDFVEMLMILEEERPTSAVYLLVAI